MAKAKQLPSCSWRVRIYDSELKNKSVSLHSSKVMRAKKKLKSLG